MFKTIGSVRVSILLIILSVFPNADLLLSWDFFELFNIIGTLGLSEIAALTKNTQGRFVPTYFPRNRVSQHKF